MKNVTIFALWILTVVIGSILFGLVVVFMESNSSRLDNFIGIVGISGMLSFLFSIPAVIIFIVANTRYQKQFTNLNEYSSKMYALHLITAGAYAAIAILIGLINGADIIGVAVILGLLLCYLPAGMICWYFGFKKGSTKHITTQNILDN